MIRHIFLLFFAFFPFYSSVEASWWNEIKGYFKGGIQATPPSIRVLVLHDAERVNLEVQGKYSLYDPYTNSYISSRYTGKSRVLEAMPDGLKWGEAFPGLYQIKIRPDEAITRTIVNRHEYEGEMYIYDIGGSISLVNQLSIEEYVRFLLAAYQEKNLEPETWAALAIAARTNAYFQSVHPKNTYWAVDAQKVDYKGRVHVPEEIDEALKVTRYMIMSRTGVYEGLATPFPSQFNVPGVESSRESEPAKISIEEANELARRGEHAAQILAKAFPGTTIMLMKYAQASAGKEG